MTDKPSLKLRFTSKKTLGDKGESFVAQWLKDKNFKIIAQNYKAKYGEIDIIAQKDELLAFIEVKTRNTKYFPISTVVNYTKQKKIINTAKYFMCQNNIFDMICRFDIATVLIDLDNIEIKYIKDAFRAQ